MSCTERVSQQHPGNALPYLPGYAALCPECFSSPKPKSKSSGIGGGGGGGGGGAFGGRSADEVVVGTCCKADGTCCVEETHFRDAVACRPRSYNSDGGGDVGFLSLPGSRPSPPYFHPYSRSSSSSLSLLPEDTMGRIATALPAFVDFTEREGGAGGRRPIVTLINQNVLTIWKYAGSDPAFSAKDYDADDGFFVREYESDMRALATRVIDELKGRGHEESTTCVVFQTSPLAQRFPLYAHLQNAVGLMATLNRAVARVGGKMKIPVFDVAGAVKLLGMEDEFLEDGFHPNPKMTDKMAPLFKVWVKQNLPKHCQLAP